MITYVAQLIHSVTVAIHNTLLAASFVGRLIITITHWMCSMFYNILENLTLFFTIVYEDNVSIFSEEIPHSTIGVFDTLKSQLFDLHDTLAIVYHGMHMKVGEIATSVQWFINAIVVIICEVLSLWKNALILVGDTLWLMITFFPIHLPLLLKSFLEWISNIIVNTVVDGYMDLLTLTNFLTEVPLESFLGITCTIIIVRVCIHFKETIVSHITFFYWSMLRQFMYVYYAVYNYWTNPEVRVITRLVNGEETEVRDVDLSTDDVDDPNNTDALCVICQERQKCVLTLPCRHVCLCAECCRRLYGYQRTCPICRTFIYHSVTVYL